MRAAVLSGFVALGLFTALPAQTAPPVEPERAISGHLRTVDGVEVLFLRGDVEERGFAEGYLMAERIRAMFRGFAIARPILPLPIAWNIKVLPGVRERVTVPDEVRVWAAALLAGMKARDEESLFVPELRRDLTVDDIVAVAALPDFMGLACSSFVVFGDAVADDGPLVGRNLDYFSTDALLEATMLIVHAPAPGRAGYVAIGWTGFAGVLTAFTSEGLSIAIHDVPAKARPEGKVTPRTIALLELATRLRPERAPAAEAAALLRGHRFGMGGNVMLGWRGEGDAHGPGGAVLELLPADDPADGVLVRAPEDGEPFVVCTNHHRLHDEPAKCWRFDRLYDGLHAAEAALTFAEARELIRTSEVRGTLYQTVADLGTGRLDVRIQRPGGRWDAVEDLDLAALLAEAERGAAEPAEAGRR